MCLLCIEIAKGKMTTKEMARAFAEVGSTEHAGEILVVLEEAGLRDEFESTLLDMAAAELGEDDE